jgi:hypothetical protein
MNLAGADITSLCNTFLIVEDNIKNYSLSDELKNKIDNRDYRKIYLKAIEIGVIIHPKENGNQTYYTLIDLGRDAKKRGGYQNYLNSLSEEETYRLLLRQSVLTTNKSLRITNKPVRDLNTTTKGYYKKQKNLTIISLCSCTYRSLYSYGIL